jgi:hypothetical protein
MSIELESDEPMSEEPHAPSNSAVVVRAMAVSANFFIIFSLVGYSTGYYKV